MYILFHVGIDDSGQEGMRAAAVEQVMWPRWRRGRVEYGPVLLPGEGEAGAGIGYVRRCIWGLFTQLCAGCAAEGVARSEQRVHSARRARAWLCAVTALACLVGLMRAVGARPV